MIKLVLNSGKNIDDLYHFTAKAGLFFLVCSDQTLRAGVKEESGPAHQGKNPFVAFTRDKNLPSKLHRDYRFGFIIDGNKLSDRYKLESISYIGHQMTKTNSDVMISRLTRYQNGHCTVATNIYGTVDIDRKTFDELAKYIENLPEDIKTKKKLTHREGGTRKVRGVGAPIAEQYAVGTKHGIVFTATRFPEITSTGSALASNPEVNEYEERVWRDKVDIGRCLKGVIIASDLNEHELYFVREGLEYLYKAGFAIKPSQNDIGFRPDKHRGNFIIERI